MHTIAIAAFVGSFVLSLLATFVVRGWARRAGFIDQPGGHKQHGTPVALGGGIAITQSILLPMLVCAVLAWTLNRSTPYEWLPELVQTHLPGIASKLPTVLALAGCMIFLHVVGLIDDRKALGPGVKFVAQFAVAFFVAGPMEIRIVEFLGPWISVFVTVLWIVLITNAFNFLDNMDGLSAGVACIASIIFALASIGVGQIFVPVLALLMAGSLAGFLVFNFSPASIFMGDAGSLVVGFLMAVLTALTTFYDPDQGLAPLGMFVPIVALAVPLYDVTSVVIHRIRLGISPLRGDRRHFSHRLVRRGLSTRGAVLTIYLATAATGTSAIVLPRVDWTCATLLLIQSICVVIIIAVLEHAGGAKLDDDPPKP